MATTLSDDIERCPEYFGCKGVMPDNTEVTLNFENMYWGRERDMEDSLETTLCLLSKKDGEQMED